MRVVLENREDRTVGEMEVEDTNAMSCVFKGRTYWKTLNTEFPADVHSAPIFKEGWSSDD